MPAATASNSGPSSLARKIEVAMNVLSLRRHDPDQVQRVTAVVSLEHDPEKSIPVFRKDHAQSISEIDGLSAPSGAPLGTPI
jgi:hypothetical protein